jgi:hypothetical protein
MASSQERRSCFDQDLEDSRRWVQTSLAGMLTGVLVESKCGFRVHPDDAARMRDIVRALGNSILRHIDTARVIEEQVPALRLVVDNTREVAHG